MMRRSSSRAAGRARPIHPRVFDHHAGEPDDHVERRAELVADLGHKSRLGPFRLFGHALQDGLPFVQQRHLPVGMHQVLQRLLQRALCRVVLLHDAHCLQVVAVAPGGDVGHRALHRGRQDQRGHDSNECDPDLPAVGGAGRRRAAQRVQAHWPAATPTAARVPMSAAASPVEIASSARLPGIGSQSAGQRESPPAPGRQTSVLPAAASCTAPASAAGSSTGQPLTNGSAARCSTPGHSRSE